MPFRSNLSRAFDEFDIDTFNLADETDEQSKVPSKAPKCPHCKITMRWFESRLAPQNGRRKIVHSFHCPNCAGIVQQEEPFKAALRPVA
jgi:hypothetical protein